VHALARLLRLAVLATTLVTATATAAPPVPRDADVPAAPTEPAPLPRADEDDDDPPPDAERPTPDADPERSADAPSPTPNPDTRRPTPVDDTDGPAEPPDATAEPPDATAEPPDATTEPPPPGTAPSDQVELTDPLAPVDAALEALRAEGFSIGEPTRTSNPLQGEVLTVEIRGTKHDYMRYVLDSVAADGYLVLLRAIGPDAYEIVALRARQNQERGLTFIGVAKFDIKGTFRARENAATLAKLVEHGGGLIIPVEVVEAMRAVGYRAELRAADVDHVEIRVVPGRSIRRVRVHGHLPLAEREVRRVLSASARPGAAQSAGGPHA
jgi:hypothetical protein